MKFSSNIITVLALSASSLLFGCATTTPIQTAVNCELSRTSHVESAFSEADAKLNVAQCVNQFDAYFEQLIKTAEGDPSPANKQHFDSLLAHAVEKGAISVTQAKVRYTSYFGRVFVSLPDQYANCSSTCVIKSAVERGLKDELRKKERGGRVIGEMEIFQGASRDYDNVMLLLEATCTACKADAS